MATFFAFVFVAAAAFGAGYYVSGHPEGARKFLVRVKDSILRLRNKTP